MPEWRFFYQTPLVSSVSSLISEPCARHRCRRWGTRSHGACRATRGPPNPHETGQTEPFLPVFPPIFVSGVDLVAVAARLRGQPPEPGPAGLGPQRHGRHQGRRPRQATWRAAAHGHGVVRQGRADGGRQLEGHGEAQKRLRDVDHVDAI